MKDKRTVICIVLIMVGLLMSLVTLVAIGFELEKLLNITENTVEIKESFNSIAINLEETDVTIKPATDGKCTLHTKCKESVSIKYTIENRELKLECETDAFTDFFTVGGSSMILYLPKDAYKNLKIIGSTGDVSLSQIDFESGEIDVSTGDVAIDSNLTKLNIKVSTGDISIIGLTGESAALKASTGDVFIKDSTFSGEIKLEGKTSDVKMKNVDVLSIEAEVSTGEIELEGVIATKEMKLKASTGDIELVQCDAEEMELKTSSGDVEGTLNTSKVFYVITKSGHVSVPRSNKGGLCQVTTSSGDVEFRIVE